MTFKECTIAASTLDTTQQPTLSQFAIMDTTAKAHHNTAVDRINNINNNNHNNYY